jgi:hypothetical protein
LESPLSRLNKKLTANEQEAARKRIQEAARRPYVYDPDSPLLSEKQLSEFRPVNFNSMEERERAMQKQETPVFV